MLVFFLAVSICSSERDCQVQKEFYQAWRMMVVQQDATNIELGMSY
jgi:hypothetical protein